MSRPSRDAIIQDEQLDVLLACRPIYTRNLDVAAFELLLAGDDGLETFSRPASRAILGTYADIYRNGEIDTVASVLRVTPAMLLAPQVSNLPKKPYILELDLGDPATDDDAAELPAQLRTLARRGYRLALAGYHPDRDDLTPLLDAVHIVRLDLSKLGSACVADSIRRLRPRGVELLVDSIDDTAQFRDCLDLGATYFQGDFFSKPTPVKGRTITGNKLLVLQLLSELQNPDTSPAALERIAIRDAHLTYRILKVVNSAAVGLNREVSSVSQAIALLGTREIRRWANLLLVDKEPGKPGELTRSMLVRGRMCEILAELCGHDSPVDHFIVGLLSQLDVLMDIAMEDLMEQVPLNTEVKQALLHREGPMGQILTEVEHYESGRFDRLTWLVKPPFYEVAYRHSTGWARQARQAMGND